MLTDVELRTITFGGNTPAEIQTTAIEKYNLILLGESFVREKLHTNNF